MDNRRTIGIIATLATAILCGCPGLFLCIFGAFTAAGSIPYDYNLNGVRNIGYIPSVWGFALLCIAVILVLIPVLIGIFTLRSKPPSQIAGPMPYSGPNEPFPPA